MCLTCSRKSRGLVNLSHIQFVPTNLSHFFANLSHFWSICPNFYSGQFVPNFWSICPKFYFSKQFLYVIYYSFFFICWGIRIYFFIYWNYMERRPNLKVNENIFNNVFRYMIIFFFPLIFFYFNIQPFLLFIYSWE